MRKYLAIAILALALLAMPAAVAAGDTASLPISGSLAKSIEVTIDPTGTLVLPMEVGNNDDGCTRTLTVETTGLPGDWSVTVSEPVTKTSHLGYMTTGADGSGSVLTEMLELGKDSYDDIDTLNGWAENLEGWMSGTGLVTEDTGVCVRQEIKNTDIAGDYQITVIFTGTVV